MKTTLGCIRRADQDFHMIAPGDRIAVGVSGGKDSLLLLYALHLYRMFSHMDYTLHAFTMTMGLEPFDLTHVRELCDLLQIPYTIRETDIGHVLFDVRKEKNPCALCAKMRRGILNDLAKEHGCNKLALAHHRDDALETLMMSLLFEGRIHTFHPVTYLSRAGLTVIRPLIYLPEKHIRHMAKVLSLPVVPSPCPANGHTRRQEMKELLASLARKYPRAPELMLSALQNEEQYGLWWKTRDAVLDPAKDPVILPPPVAEMGRMEEAGETGSEAERRLWRIKRSGGSERNEQRERQRSDATIEPPGLRALAKHCDD